jgi:hypothetical protein
MVHAKLKCVAIAAWVLPLFPVSQEAAAVPARSGPLLVVPTDYPTIQSTRRRRQVGRDSPGARSTYTERVTIDKDLDLVGAGLDMTIIRAPATLVPGPLGSPAIVEILDESVVSISSLTISGPGAAACGDPNVLRWGVRVHPGSHLDLGHSAVRDIHNTPMAMCPRSATAISVGSSTPGSLPPSLVIHDSEVTHFQSVGVIVLGAGSWADIAHNTVAGPGHVGGVPTTGIELVAGAPWPTTPSAETSALRGFRRSAERTSSPRFRRRGSLRAGMGRGR